jgi:hypothetical protein
VDRSDPRLHLRLQARLDADRGLLQPRPGRFDRRVLRARRSGRIT